LEFIWLTVARTKRNFEFAQQQVNIQYQFINRFGKNVTVY